MALPTRVCLATSIPGPRGTNGLPGADGADGASASTILTADFTVPDQGSSADASVEDSSVFSIGQVIYLALAGYFQVVGIPDATTITLLNLRDDAAAGFSSNAPGLYGGVGDPNGQQFGWQWSHWTGEVDGSEWVKTSAGFGDTGWEQLL
jgi:hypothetical protein